MNFAVFDVFKTLKYNNGVAKYNIYFNTSAKFSYSVAKTLSSSLSFLESFFSHNSFYYAVRFLPRGHRIYVLTRNMVKFLVKCHSSPKLQIRQVRLRS